MASPLQENRWARAAVAGSPSRRHTLLQLLEPVEDDVDAGGPLWPPRVINAAGGENRALTYLFCITYVTVMSPKQV